MTISNIIALIAGASGLFVSIVSYILVVAKMRWEIERMSSNLQKIWTHIDSLTGIENEARHLDETVKSIDSRMCKLEATVDSIREIIGELRSDVRHITRTVDEHH